MNFNRKSFFIVLIILLVIFVVLIFFLRGTQIKNTNILANFIEWFSVLQSILLALVVVQVWSKFTTVEMLVDKEADAWASFLRFARFLDSPDHAQSLAQHVKNFCKDWSEYIPKDKKALSKYRDYVDQIFSILKEMTAKQKDGFVVKEMLRTFDEAIDTRYDMAALIKERTPETFWLLLIFASMVWLLSFFWLGFQGIDVVLSTFMLAGTTLTLLLLLAIAWDIDNPASGFWKIKFQSFDDTLEEAERLIEKLKKEDRGK